MHVHQTITTSSPTFRWLGTAGLELTYNGFTLLIDPYLTRIPLGKVFFGTVTADETAIFKQIVKADAILVTHSHFDHCMDVAPIAKRFSCTVYGSANTALLCEKNSVRPDLLKIVQPGMRFSAGPFSIAVVQSSHRPMLLSLSGTLHHSMGPPNRAFDYRMDTQLGFMISAGNCTFMTDPGRYLHPGGTDILFLSTLQKRPVIRKTLGTTDAAVIVPVHWDNYFRKITPEHFPPRWRVLPVNSYSMEALRKMITRRRRERTFFVPELFTRYRTEEVLHHSC